MAVVTGLTADRMKAIENAAIVEATVSGDNLLLTRNDGVVVNAGSVRGNPGSIGPAGGYFNDVTFDDLPATGIVSAHRSGGGGGATTATVPENTIEGAWRALSLGAHILDIDVQRTADGSFVLMHDDTVDRTTKGYGLVSKHYASNIPPIDPRECSGEGWGAYLQAPTLQQFLSIFGGKCIITIEAKGGVENIVALANIIKDRGLANSVFLNSGDVATISTIVSNGVRAHLWAWSDTTKVVPGIDAGASLIEIPWNADAALVSTCQAAVADSNKNLDWFIAGPTYKRSEVKNMTSGIMGHVSDLIGHTNRVSDAPLIDTIRPSLMAGKRGIGWRFTTVGAHVQNTFNLVVQKGFSWDDVEDSTGAGLYLGDMSGTMPTNYTITVKFVPDSAFVGNSAANVRFRVASTIGEANGSDSETNGYIGILNGNGRLRLYVAGATLTDPTILLYENTSAANFVAGNEYSIAVTITPTSVSISASGTGLSKASSNISNTAYRGEHIYLWRVSANTPDTFITDIART